MGIRRIALALALAGTLLLYSCGGGGGGGGGGSTSSNSWDSMIWDQDSWG